MDYLIFLKTGLYEFAATIVKTRSTNRLLIEFLNSLFEEDYFQEENFMILPRPNRCMPMHSRIVYDRKGNPDILEVYLAKMSLDSLRHKQAVLAVSKASSFGDVYYPRSCEDMIVKGKVF